MTFQPAELAKISFILTLALHLSRVRGRVNQPKNLLLLLIAHRRAYGAHPYPGR